VGSYPILQGTLTLGGNYDLTYAGANLVITPKPASVTPDAAGKTYGDADPTLAGSLSGFLSGDNVTAVYSRTAGENVGSYTISAVLSPVGVLGNYNITYNTAAFAITKANLTVTADSTSRTYGYPNPAFTGVLTGVTNGDSITASYSSTADATSRVGQYPIVPSLNDPGSRLGNYNVTITNGTLEVTKRTLNVNANPQSKTYGDTFTFGGTEFTTGSGDLINGDNVASVTLTSNGAAASAGVGGYPIVISNAAGTGLGNYQIFYSNSTLTVNARPAVWTTSNSGKTYGNGDPSPLTSGSGDFLAADGVSAAYSRAAGENVGTYHITATLSATGNLGNYSITNNGADFVISQRPATVTANPKSKFYGDANPMLDAVVTGAAGSEVLNYTLSTTADNTSGIGGYPITVTLGSNPNYSITPTDGTLTVNARAVTITADAKSKTYGDADPALTYQITVGTLANGDSFSGNLSRAAGESVGTYAIQQSTVALSSNYDLHYIGADLTIGKRNATWTANDSGKVFANSDPSPLTTGSGSNFVAADNITATYSRASGESVGTYHITATLGPAAALGNYCITNNGATFTISNNAPSGITANAPTISENDTATISGSFVDADLNQPHTVTIKWNDSGATSTIPLASGVFSFNASHQYLDDDPTVTSSDVYAITVDVTDNAATVSAVTTVTVRNVNPVITAANGPVAPQPLGSSSSVTAAFTDVGTRDTHKCSFDWDDTTVTSNVAATEMNGGGSCTAARTFTAAGVYSVNVTVSDDDIGSATKLIEQFYVVIYDPNGGFVTGGGWITSPANACHLTTACEGLTGKANFGFVSKYKKGSNTPDGQTEFQFQAGNLNFHSSAYDVGSLVVSGYKAQYKGVGDINGQPGYKFILTAYDGDLQSAGSPDRFRMKIIRISDSAVVYDNNIGSTDDIDSVPMALSGGSINIQKAGK
jgi:hypothetical protein